MSLVQLIVFVALFASPLFLQNSQAVSVFQKGAVISNDYPVDESEVASNSPPKPLLIVTPTVKGTYPVVLFLPGTCLLNSYYTHLLLHISSHGYIIVAPQLYSCLEYGFIPMLPIKGTSELDYAAKVTNWLPSGLQTVLPENVVGDLEKLCVGGHSRGGKIAFALALGYAETPLQMKISALAGVDPVEGIRIFNQDFTVLPEVLTYEPDSLNLTIPVVVIGTGLGNQSICKLFCPACASEGLNHNEFFNECKAPTGHFVATKYGHMDMLNDNISDIVGELTISACKSGELPKDPMRRSVGGIIVAFLDAYFEGKAEEYMNIVEQPSIAPIELNPVQFKSLYVNHAQVA